MSILRKAQNTIQKIGQCSEVPSEVTHESFAVTRLAPETEDTHTSSPKPEPVSTTHDHGTAGLGNSNGMCGKNLFNELLLLLSLIIHLHCAVIQYIPRI